MHTTSQGQIEAVPCEKAFVGLDVLASGPHSVATLDTDVNEQPVPSTPVTHFVLGKYCDRKGKST